MSSPIRGASLATTFSDLTSALSAIAIPSKADVFVSMRRFGQNIARPIKVLWHSEAYYWCNERELELLRAGTLPEDLGLEPAGENE